ncbi:MAG: restriction endonuclease subunit S, partial [Verrucomicrobia bacterium]|nr:restriction endonuclease subunit S [Verrucomicrobiota bacterium]
HPDEGTAEDLVVQLAKKKCELEKNSKIYKKSKTKPFYDSAELEEISIPKSWRWVQLSNVSIIQEGAGIRKWQYRTKGIQILCVTNILEDAIDLKKKELYISREEYLEKYQHLTLSKGDIVTSCSGGSWGKIAFFNCDETLMLNTSTLRLRFFGDIANNNYLYYVCKSSFFKTQLKLQLSGMQPNFGYAHYSRIMIPLPPLEEQKRIVAKIEEIFPYIERFGELRSQLRSISEDLRKSILQQAIQGKLVEQRPEEGTAEELYRQIQSEKAKLLKAGKIKKEKPLPEITEDEIPFEIPQTWKWVHFSELMISISTGPFGSMLHKSDYVQNGIPLVNPANIINGKIVASTKMMVSEETAKRLDSYKLHPNMLIIGRRGEMGRCAIVSDKEEGWICGTGSFFMEPSHLLNTTFLLLFFHTSYAKKYLGSASIGTTMSNLNHNILKKIPVPLPPLTEQKRIIAKIEKLLPFCDKLK